MTVKIYDTVLPGVILSNNCLYLQGTIWRQNNPPNFPPFIVQKFIFLARSEALTPITMNITLYEPDAVLPGRNSHLFWTLYMATYPTK